MTNLPDHKTKIVCTIGPASDSLDMMRQMLKAGMDIARLNFSHGNFERYRTVIKNLRESASAENRRLTIMADLPGPKIRIGQIKNDTIDLKPGSVFTLTTDAVVGNERKVSVTLPTLPKVVCPGNHLYLNDGLIELEVVQVLKHDVKCHVLVGGELRSRKGLNVPGIDLGIEAFTDHDRQCLKFALEQGVDAISQSFVHSEKDILSVRRMAMTLGYKPFIIAKIERSTALDHIDNILEAADGIMVARGDLGVETPIEQIAYIQKWLIKKANMLGKPVITATQMLESMTVNPYPTRAESTDVANAILDGTDCVMLSGESAMGKYPVEAVTMLAKIAAAMELHRAPHYLRTELENPIAKEQVNLTDLIALNVETTLRSISPAAVFVPTRGGATARSITRFRLPVWVVGVSTDDATCQQLQFSYGVYPEYVPEHPDNWKEFIAAWLYEHHEEGQLVVVTEGPSRKHPDANNRIEIIDLYGKYLKNDGL
jgi:pyruvate kinase